MSAPSPHPAPPLPPARQPHRLTPPFSPLPLLCRYSAIKAHLAELDKQTLEALGTLYNFSGASPLRARRQAAPQPPGKGLFLQHFPLTKLETLRHKPATGHKRRIAETSEGSAMVKDPKDIVGFKLVGPPAGLGAPGGWPAEAERSLLFPPAPPTSTRPSSSSPSPQCDSSNNLSCVVYNFSSGVNAIREWYKLHYMNIMAQISAQEKARMSYSAEELILSCSFDGMSCDARSAPSLGRGRGGWWCWEPKGWPVGAPGARASERALSSKELGLPLARRPLHSNTSSSHLECSTIHQHW